VHTQIVTSSCVLDCLDVAVGAVVDRRGAAGTTVVAAAAGATAAVAAAAATTAAAAAVAAAAVAAAVDAAVDAAVRAFCSASTRGTRDILQLLVWLISPCWFHFFVPEAAVAVLGVTCVFIRCMQKNVDHSSNGWMWR
jgi:hypothetical protein